MTSSSPLAKGARIFLLITEKRGFPTKSPEGREGPEADTGSALPY